jgi:hypothetical protein
VVVGKSRQRRLPGRVTTREAGPVAPFTASESFHYFLTELELTVASGRIDWTVTSAAAARRRLVKLMATLGQSGAWPKNNGPSS